MTYKKFRSEIYTSNYHNKDGEGYKCAKNMNHYSNIALLLGSQSKLLQDVSL